jgi:hypothetical protein
MTAVAAAQLLIAPNGALMGTATLVDGLLTVRGTDAGEEIVLGMEMHDPSQVCVRIVRYNVASGSFCYPRADVTGIVVEAGDGDDYVNFLSWVRALDVPITINGGAGNDLIEGGGSAYDDDGDLSRVVDISYVGAVLRGDAGNDTICSGFGPDVMDGGDGDDLLETTAEEMAHDTMVHSGGNDTVQLDSLQGHVFFPLNPPAPEPTPAEPAEASPAEPEQPAATTSPMIAAPAPVTAPVTFGTNELLVSDSKLWDL